MLKVSPRDLYCSS